jgi:hypothetical protein
MLRMVPDKAAFEALLLARRKEEYEQEKSQFAQQAKAEAERRRRENEEKTRKKREEQERQDREDEEKRKRQEEERKRREEEVCCHSALLPLHFPPLFCLTPRPYPSPPPFLENCSIGGVVGKLKLRGQGWGEGYICSLQHLLHLQQDVLQHCMRLKEGV